MDKYYFAQLNPQDICETILIYNQPLQNPPDNYIPVAENQDVQWRKHENGQWSEEKFEPVPAIPEPIQPTNQEINDNLMVIMNGLTDIYMATLGL